MMNAQQKKAVLEAMAPHMILDAYGRTTIRNIYFDTDNYRLIRRSIEKPMYKEKLRIRSYSQVSPEDSVFVELKKKYDSVVYKRRLTLTDKQAFRCFANDLPIPGDTQIAREIEYFRQFYSGLKPAVFLTYEREAFYTEEDPDFRITLDENILYREEDFALGSHVYGTRVLPEEVTLMEIKTAGGLPLWMTQVLSEAQIYRTSFSKYGSAYTDICRRQMEEAERRYRYA